MHAEISIWIDAAPEAVYRFVADLARWPDWLPHYRYVRILSHDGRGTLAAMSARRGWIPVFWEALQTPEPETRQVRFHHVRGVTRGMDVLWTLEPERGGTRARIRHDLMLRWPGISPWIRAWFAEQVIARGFIQPIAGRTLARFKRLAEAR